MGRIHGRGFSSHCVASISYKFTREFCNVTPPLPPHLFYALSYLTSWWKIVDTSVLIIENDRSSVKNSWILFVNMLVFKYVIQCRCAALSQNARALKRGKRFGKGMRLLREMSASPRRKDDKIMAAGLIELRETAVVRSVLARGRHPSRAKRVIPHYRCRAVTARRDESTEGNTTRDSRARSTGAALTQMISRLDI